METDFARVRFSISKEVINVVDFSISHFQQELLLKGREK